MHQCAPIRILAAVIIVYVATASATAQDRRAQPGRAQVQVAVDLKIGSQPLQANGSGSCTHAPQASIYDVRSQLRSVRYSSGGGSVQLTLWDPLDGAPDMFSLSTNAGTTNGTISTVRGGKIVGSGTVTFEPAGKGGAFRVSAKAADGTAISGTIKCDAFTPHAAEGG
jgi:hypothetical protein